MKIYIDADACPVTDIAVKIATDLNIACILVCDTSHEIRKAGAETVIVDKRADSADFKIINMISPGDIVITQDYGLASMCLAKKAFVINQNGAEYTNDNIIFLMESRYESKKQRMSGIRLKGPKPRTYAQDFTFEKNFQLLVSRCINSSVSE